MQVVAANLWNLNPRQLTAIHRCLQYEADVVVLPELKRSHIADAEKLLADKGYTLIHAPVHRNMSLGIASRIPTTNIEAINKKPFIGRPQIKLQLKNGIIFWGIHLDAPISLYRHRQRREQLFFLAQIIKQSQAPTVLAGDFNSYFSESIFQSFLREIGHQQYLKPRERLHTWPSVFPLFKIDHILCNQSLKVIKLKRGEFNGSDHLPIHACVKFR